MPEPFVQKAVVLCGPYHHHCVMPDPELSAPLCPLVMSPLLRYTVDALVGVGVREVIFLSGIELGLFLSDARATMTGGVRLTEHHEYHFKGTAGDLRELEGRLSPFRFFVVKGNVLLQPEDLLELARVHAACRAVATSGVRSQDGPAGLYLFEPDVFPWIDKGYMDIDEQLIPRLLDHGAVTATWDYSADRESPRAMRHLEDFMTSEHQMLMRGLGNPGQITSRLGPAHLSQIADGVWVGRNVRISSWASVIGPVVIGDGAEVEPQARIVGPCVIGRNGRVGRGADIRATTLWDGAVVHAGSRVERCLAGVGAEVPRGATMSSSLVLGKRESVGTLALALALARPAGGARLAPKLSFGDRLRLETYACLKRLLDVTGAVLGLGLAVPVLLLAAVAIKLESPGPVFYRQRRCGKDGIEFQMIKFRTMCEEADARQETLRAQNDVEGPVFKLFHDPRVTRVGWFLRETSLDEIPQLLNVLAGEMSLVGPRPLARRELWGCSFWKTLRLKVKPGITGPWQVRGRNSPEFYRWIKLDTDYVFRQGMKQDLELLGLTCWLTGRNLMGIRRSPHFLESIEGRDHHTVTLTWPECSQ